MTTYTNIPSATPNEPTNPGKKDNRSLIYGLLIVALLGTWTYVLIDKAKTKEQTENLQNQLAVTDSSKKAIENDYNQALQRLDELTTMNASMDSLVRARNTEIENMKARIRTLLNKQNATAAELAEAKRLINELNATISNYVEEIAQLREENKQLRSEKQELTMQKAQLQEEVYQTKEEKKKVEEKLDVASTLIASNINVVAINEKSSGKEKETTSARRADIIRASFEIFNRVGETGSKDIYVVITDPNGQIISNEALGSGRFMTRDEGERIYTKKSTVNFTAGQKSNVNIDWKPGSRFVEGNYKVEVYNNGFKIGEATKKLRKGGLFG